MDEPPFTLKLNERNEVVMIQNGERTMLGRPEEACEELCRFLAEIDYGDCPRAGSMDAGAELDAVS